MPEKVGTDNSVSNQQWIAQSDEIISQNGVFRCGNHSIARYVFRETPFVISNYPDQMIQNIFDIKEQLTGAAEISYEEGVSLFQSNREEKLLKRMRGISNE